MDAAKLLLLKRHCRADDIADPAEDAYFAHLYAAAREVVVSLTNRSACELSLDGLGEDFPPDLEHAVIMLAAHLHNQPEGASAASMSIDPALTAIVKKYERLSGR